MKVNQIASILNSVFDEIIGESAVINEDLSNIVDVGRTITSSTTWGDNFDNYVKKIIDKVGRTIFVDREYTSTAPAIYKDSWEYASVLEKVRCDVGDFEDTATWDLNNYTPDVFSFTAPTVSAKYYNSKTTFSLKISIAEKQLKSAFESASNMNQFISMIENRIKMKAIIARDGLVMRTIVNLIAEKINNNNNVVNLLTEFKAATGDTTTTAATAMYNKDFLRFAAKTIMTYKKLISVASMLYNDGGFVTFTPEDRLKSVFTTDFVKALETTLYADTFNEEFVKLAGYSEVPYWQGTGTANDEHLKINVKLASDNTKTVEQDGVVAVMFDDWACMVCNDDPRVTSVYNPEAEFYNYWYKYDCSYFNDTNENCIVFIIADGE